MFPRSNWLLALLMVSGAFASSRDQIPPKTDKSPAELVSPKEGDAVAEAQEYEGRLTNGGWPVILVQPLVEDAPWWVQPPVEDVVGGKFTGRAYFGDANTPKSTRFAVVILVVKSKAEGRKFKTGMTLKELPADLPRSSTVTVSRDAQSPRPRDPRTLYFAGKTWRVKGGKRLGPGPNDWSDAEDNVWVDKDGHLHLAITKIDGRWHCAEIVADKSLGYGEYRWVVSGDLAGLDRNAVLGLFTYENTSREIDFELSRWGDAAKANAQYVVQPYTVKGNMHRFDTGDAKVLTVSITWEKAQVHCRCWAGEDTTKAPLADWLYKGRHIPLPGKERARANLWLFGGRTPASGAWQEIVIRSFHFQAGALQKKAAD